MSSTSSLRLLTGIKQVFCMETYFFKVKYFKYRQYISMLRLGTLPIRCNTGRYEKLLYNERLCTLCSLNEVQDEYHLCIKCPSFDKDQKDVLARLGNSL